MKKHSPQAFRQSTKVLKNAAPEEFGVFLHNLETYADELTVAVTQAPPTEIMNAQGRAQIARALVRHCLECDVERQEPAAQQF